MLARGLSAWRKLLRRQRIAWPVLWLRYDVPPFLASALDVSGRNILTEYQIDAATKEKGSGSFALWTGETFPW